MKNLHIGSSLDDFLAEEGLLDEVSAAALQRVSDLNSESVNAVDDISNTLKKDKSCLTPTS